MAFGSSHAFATRWQTDDRAELSRLPASQEVAKGKGKN